MNSTEYQAPDTAAKTQAGLDSDYQAETEDILGEKMVLNMGPSHPATHGVLRLILELDDRFLLNFSIKHPLPDKGRNQPMIKYFLNRCWNGSA